MSKRYKYRHQQQNLQTGLKYHNGTDKPFYRRKELTVALTVINHQDLHLNLYSRTSLSAARTDTYNTQKIREIYSARNSAPEINTYRRY